MSRTVYTINRLKMYDSRSILNKFLDFKDLNKFSKKSVPNLLLKLSYYSLINKHLSKINKKSKKYQRHLDKQITNSPNYSKCDKPIDS